MAHWYQVPGVQRYTVTTELTDPLRRTLRAKSEGSFPFGKKNATTKYVITPLYLAFPMPNPTSVVSFQTLLVKRLVFDVIPGSS